MTMGHCHRGFLSTDRHIPKGNVIHLVYDDVYSMIVSLGIFNKQ